MRLSSLIFLLKLDLGDQYALPNLFTTRHVQFLTLYASWMRAVSTNFKEICGVLVCRQMKPIKMFALEK